MNRPAYSVTILVAFVTASCRRAPTPPIPSAIVDVVQRDAHAASTDGSAPVNSLLSVLGGGNPGDAGYHSVFGLGAGNLGDMTVHPAESPSASLRRVTSLPEVRALITSGRARITLRPDDADMTSCTGSADECSRWVRVDRRNGSSYVPWHSFVVDPVSGVVTVGTGGLDARGFTTGQMTLAAWRAQGAP